MQSLWFCLLDAWHKQNRYGLTFPFIVGALREPVGSVAPGGLDGPAELLGILEKIRYEMPEDKHGLIKPCYTIDEVVLGFSAGDKPMTKAIPFFSAAQQRNTLFIDASLYPELTDAIDLSMAAAALWNRYGDRIAAGHFSKNGEWGGYTGAERAWIDGVVLASRRTESE